MRFDVVLANPPFQDTTRRGKTPHKLWIDFTLAAFERFLVEGGVLCQVSPASFQSPSSKVLVLMRSHRTAWIDFDAGAHFTGVGSSFAAYLIEKAPHDGSATLLTRDGVETSVPLDGRVFYLPTDGPMGLAIHRKVIFEHESKLAVEWDYVSAHNARLREASPSLSRERTAAHRHEVFHTNGQRWWSSIRQPVASEPKVVWTRSGYQRPFADAGTLGVTDMAYFVRVGTPAEAEILAANLSLELIRYIFATAKWSGFGNERVFAALPDLPRDRRLDDDELYAMFAITEEERAHVRRLLDAGR